MKTLSIMIGAMVVLSGTGCSSATLGAIKGSAELICCAYMVCKASEKPDAPRTQEARYSQPWSPLSHQPMKTAEGRATQDVRALRAAAMTLYKEFEYSRVMETTSCGLSVAVSREDRAFLFMLRGAASYLLNDLAQAESSFRAAKQEGTKSMDPRVFPQDMSTFFQKVQ